MDIRVLVNNNATNTHTSPTALRFTGLAAYNAPHTRRNARGPNSPRACKWGNFRIAWATSKTIRQMQGAMSGPLSPRRNRVGRKPVIKTPKKNTLIEFLNADPINRRLPWADLRYYIPGYEVYGEHAITTALRSLC
ncbi:hypothetical protein DL764_007830 [Monosporascus ibericus]|uniref:Uncharacterized protein n=1 Tax=Monosporascus ibericus TaxID=155417 RepID=A0A4Q4SZ28_9PEZI|nr:hypothetical protein DL764_007830 [Monosporascus ibericus]